MNPPRYSTRSSNPWWSTQEIGTLFYKVFEPMIIYIRTRRAILQNIQNHENTHESGTLFYKIFKLLKIHTRTRKAILQNLQTHEGTHKNPARFSTISSNLWGFTQEPDTLFYKIYKPMKIKTRVRQAYVYSTKSSNPWWSTHEPSKLFYEINYVKLLNFKLMLVKTNNTRFSKFNVLTIILPKILTSCLIHSVVRVSLILLSVFPQVHRLFQSEFSRQNLQGTFHLEGVLRVFVHVCEDTVGITDYTVQHWMIFFFFNRRYNSRWVLACFTVALDDG
jgi:hypothetical protein